MKSEFGRARRLGQPLACVVIRIEGLSRVAELVGGAARDQIRDVLTDLVREKTRDYDHLGLVGDDGCLLVLPQTDAEGAKVVAERIRRGFTAVEPAASLLDRAGAPQLRTNLSLGISAAHSSETLFFDTLLAQAEHARDVASAAGGDRVEVFDRDRFVGDPRARD